MLSNCSIEKTYRHFDRSVPKGREVEKSIKKQILSRATCGERTCLERCRKSQTKPKGHKKPQKKLLS